MNANKTTDGKKRAPVRDVQWNEGVWTHLFNSETSHPLGCLKRELMIFSIRQVSIDRDYGGVEENEHNGNHHVETFSFLLLRRRKCQEERVWACTWREKKLTSKSVNGK